MRGTVTNSNMFKLIYWVKKKKKKKKSYRRKFKKPTKKTTYTSLPMCLHTNYYTKETVYSSVKVNAVISGQGVGNNNALSFIEQKFVSTQEILGVFAHGAVLYYLCTDRIRTVCLLVTIFDQVRGPSVPSNLKVAVKTMVTVGDSLQLGLQ